MISKPPVKVFPTEVELRWHKSCIVQVEQALAFLQEIKDPNPNWAEAYRKAITALNQATGWIEEITTLDQKEQP